MKNIPKVFNINSTCSQFEVEKINPLFSKAKIYVMHHGENRNMSNISKESVEKSLETIYNIPIVGEFKITEDGDGNFGGHGGRLEVDDDGIRYIETTKPIGVIPSDAEVYWTTVVDEKEREREYLVVDGAYLWNRYQDEISTLKEDNFGQSMEIEVTNGEWDEEQDVFNIYEFVFSALCILGIEKNGDGHVEPCFEDAKIITYSLEENTFKEEFSTMMKELKSFSKKELNGEEVFENMLDDILKEFSLTVEDLDKKEIKYKDLSEEELRAEIEKSFKSGQEQEHNQDTVSKEDYEGVVAELNMAKESIKDLNDSMIVMHQNELKNNQTLSELNDEVNELREFKINVEKEIHEEKFENLIAELGLKREEVEHIDVFNSSMKDIEKECYMVLGKKYAKKSSSTKADGMRFSVVDENPKVNDSPYGDLFDRYSSKK